jgi:exodeoxyribonuclease V alpha subunit
MENCKWIGPEISMKLVNTFGEETLDICKSHPKRIAKKIPGITKARALEISAMLKNNEANEELQLQLKGIVAGIRISKRAVSKIIELYGQHAPEQIKKNPYQLIEDIKGIGFLSADEIAVKVGFDKEGKPRIQAGVIHVLKESAFSLGHTCVPFKLLITESQKLLQVSEENIIQVVNQLVEEKHLVNLEDYIYLQSYYENEKFVAEKLKLISSQKSTMGTPKYDDLQEDQIDALKKSVENQVFVLTGAPGTGKTFTIKRIIDSFPKSRVALAAPTGKAAKRIFEESGMKALTIHKLLEPQKEGDIFHFTRDESNPLDADIIILDEVSMIDVSLMTSFLKAVAPKTRLIMVGDTYQLPSVGPGNILKDIISSGAIPVTELTIIKRQDEGLIINNCHKIKNGQDIELDNTESKDFFFLQRNSEDIIRETIFELITCRLKESYNINPLKDVQIISPLRERTSLSCKAFNIEYQNKLNTNPYIDKCQFKVGDKVIQTKNEYEKDIINGDLGYIRSINLQEKTIYVDFENPGRLVEIPLYDNNLDLAYCITCHKFQGSEAPIIIIPIHKAFGTLITQRNWLYTAISRARDVCILAGQRQEIPKIIRRNHQQKRFTNLARFLYEKSQ